MRRFGGIAAVVLAAGLAAAPAAAQRDPQSTQRLLERIDRLPAGRDANLVREFGLPEWNARVLAAAERFWIDQGGRPGAAPVTVTYRTRLPSGFNFDRYELNGPVEMVGTAVGTRANRSNGGESVGTVESRRRGGWIARRVHLRRVEVTDAASRTFPLDALWRAYLRSGRNAASPAFQQERRRLLPDPEVVARAVLVRIEAADARSCPALSGLGERAVALAAERPAGETLAVAADAAPHVLAVRGRGGRETMFRGPARSTAGAWGEDLWRRASGCWRLQSINNPNRR